MREPDALDTPTRLAAPRAWAAALLTCVLVAGAGAWSVTGRLPQALDAPGLLTRPLGVSALQSPYGGMLGKMTVRPGDTVAAGQEVAEITDPEGVGRPVRSPFSGAVVSVPAAVGQAVAPGSLLASVERTDGPGDRPVAMLFVPSARAAAVAPGAAVALSVPALPERAHGLLRGRVTSVGRYPLSAQEVSALLGGNPGLAGLSGSEPVTEVLVDLSPDPRTPSGYSWSTRLGPPGPLGTPQQLTGSLDLGARSPISLVLGG
ncbi:HlyD family efflux transporter periplasmic adaptor subunit [Kitasatospora cineracea]|uniref:HlyD family efflux transporter periplasmic adaptor subunit n=1 Tax=Kitasatospora cineracea TaxID=88074 RepID=UPI0038118276